jgi:hypothetical protein
MEEEPILYASTSSSSSSPSYQQLVRVSVNPKWCFSDEIEADELQSNSSSKIIYRYASQQSAPTLPSVTITQGPFERSKDYHDNHQHLQSFLGLEDYQRSIDRINLSNRSLKIEPTTFANLSILLGIVIFLFILIPGIFDLRR